MHDPDNGNTEEHREYINPYVVGDLDDENCRIYREDVRQFLKRSLLQSRPTCISIVAERQMAVINTIHRFLAHNAMALPVQVVECNFRTDFYKKEEHISHFYRGLVRIILEQFPEGSDQLRALGEQIVINTEAQTGTLTSNLERFFVMLKNQMNRPILVVFYHFDRLPLLFPMELNDWLFLRRFSNLPKFNVYFLTVSRRPLRYLELKNQNLRLSRFSTLFNTIKRFGLVSPEEARRMILLDGENVLPENPFIEALVDKIIEWSGRNPYCIHKICEELFQRIWNDREMLYPTQYADMEVDFEVALTPYFDMLYDALTKDDLHHDLYNIVVEKRPSPSAPELIDLGFFLPEKIRRSTSPEYVLFSPLFEKYLRSIGALPSKNKGKEIAEDEEIRSAKVRQFLQDPHASSQVQRWILDYYKLHPKSEPNPLADEYIALFLTAYINLELTQAEFRELRKPLFERYFARLKEQGETNKDAKRTTFYSRLDRRYKEFQKDEDEGLIDF